MFLCPGMVAMGAQPDAVIPADSLPQRWQYESELAGELPQSDPNPWWKAFGDTTLDSLIAKGLENNYNVLMAARRMEVTRQTLNEVRSQYFPSLALNAGWTKSRTSGAIASPNGRATASSYFDMGLNMSWQADVFGKIHAQAKQAGANLRASRAEYAGVMLTMSGDIASSYIQLRMLQAQKDVALSHLENQLAVLKIAQARHEAGLASQLDVLQASTVYYSTQATLPGLEASLVKIANALSVLTGESPESPKPWLAPQFMPDYHVIITAGVPMELLRRRPDIAQAEAELAATAAAVGIAKKDFLPNLTLNASIGTSAGNIGHLFKNNSLEYTVAPTLSWTLFDGLRRKYALTAAREQMLADIDNYNLTLITAIEEVENSLASYSYACQEVATIEKVVDQASRSVDLSVSLYKSGLSGFTDVANAQLTYLNYSNSLIEARGKALTALVNLVQALGGGWTTDNM